MASANWAPVRDAGGAADEAAALGVAAVGTVLLGGIGIGSLEPLLLGVLRQQLLMPLVTGLTGPHILG